MLLAAERGLQRNGEELPELPKEDSSEEKELVKELNACLRRMGDLRPVREIFFLEYDVTSGVTPKLIALNLSALLLLTTKHDDFALEIVDEVRSPCFQECCRLLSIPCAPHRPHRT